MDGGPRRRGKAIVSSNAEPEGKNIGAPAEGWESLVGVMLERSRGDKVSKAEVEGLLADLEEFASRNAGSSGRAARPSAPDSTDVSAAGALVRIRCIRPTVRLGVTVHASHARFPSVARELVAHSCALRRLARDLVGRCDADDLVQDTAVRALRSPPPAPSGLFSWFATVMRHLAANRRRGEYNRRRR